MSAILLPEVIIYKTLESIVKLLRDDLQNNREDATILYRLLGVDEDGKPLSMNLYNFFVQAKKIITTPENLNVHFGYNQETAKQIALHIILPAEQGKSAIGEDEGYLDEDEVNAAGDRVVQQQFTNTFESTYQIMITGYNSSEVNLVYNILKSMLLMVNEHLELMGLRIPTLSGNDIIMQDDIVPVPTFHKVINLSFTYELTVPKLLKDRIMKDFWLNVRICDPFDESRCIPIKPRGKQV